MLQTIIYGSFALNLFLSGSLAQLWSMINCLQLIVKMPLFNLAFPGNAQYFYNFVNNIATFNILPTNDIIDQMFNFNDDGETPDNFQTMGYGNANIVQNLGTSFFFLIALASLIIFGLILKFLSRKVLIIERVYLMLGKVLFYNIILRTFLESYLEFYFGSLLQINQLRWGNASEGFASVFNMLLFIILTLYLFFVAGFFTKFQRKLQDPSTFEAFGSLYEGINTNNRAALMFNLIYLARRMLFAILAVFTFNSPNFQMQTMILHSVLVALYLVLVRPFETIRLNYQELFNEFCIIGVSYHLLIFSDYVGNYDLQYQGGWAVICLTLLNIGVNMALVIQDNIKKVFNKIKLLYKKRKSKISKVTKQIANNMSKTQASNNFTESPESLNKSTLDNSFSALQTYKKTSSAKKQQRKIAKSKNKHDDDKITPPYWENDIWTYDPSPPKSKKSKNKSLKSKKSQKTQKNKTNLNLLITNQPKLNLQGINSIPGQNVYKTKEEFIDYIDPQRMDLTPAIHELHWRAYLNYCSQLKNYQYPLRLLQPEILGKVQATFPLQIPYKQRDQWNFLTTRGYLSRQSSIQRRIEVSVIRCKPRTYSQINKQLLGKELFAEFYFRLEFGTVQQQSQKFFISKGWESIKLIDSACRIR